MDQIRKINVRHVREIAHSLAAQTMSWDEPIPPFETRYPNKLESCVATPFQSYGKKDLYPTLVEKSSILFYLMVKNHPFENGNKRIAITTLLTFLYMNRKWLKIDHQELYNFAKWVASSPAQVKDSTVLAIGQLINRHIREYHAQ